MLLNISTIEPPVATGKRDRYDKAEIILTDSPYAASSKMITSPRNQKKNLIIDKFDSTTSPAIIISNGDTIAE